MSQATALTVRPWSPAIIALLLFLAAVVPELPALHGAFQWDDEELHITKNVNIQDTAGLLRTWISPTANVQYYPLAITVFWCEYHLFGLDGLAGYHLVNFLMHGLNTLLVWRLLCRLKVPWPGIAALLFAIHPMAVESVAYISEAKNLFSGFFFLIASHLWLSWQTEAMLRQARYGLMVLAFAAAMFSKSITCTFPVVMLLLEYWQTGRISRRVWVASIPLFVIAGSLALLFIHMEHAHVGAAGAAFTFTPVERLLIAGGAACFYPVKFLWPVNLLTVYPRWTIDVGSGWQYLFPAIAVGVVAGSWMLRSRLGRAPAVIACLYLVLIGPALGFVSYYPMLFTFVANHYAYLALIPLSVGVAAGLRTVIVRLKAVSTVRVEGVLAGVLAIVLVPLTMQQAGRWRTTVSLWEPTVAGNPDSWYATSNLAYAYLQNGLFADAAVMAQRSLALHGDNARGCFSLGCAELGLHEYPAAVEAFRRGLASEDTNVVAWFDLALSLDAEGDYPAAEDAYRRALELDPNQARAWNNLGTLLLRRGGYSEAAAAARRALAIDGHYGHAHATLGMALEKLAQYPEAAQELQTALSLLPENPPLQRELAKVQQQLTTAPTSSTAP